MFPSLRLSSLILMILIDIFMLIMSQTAVFSKGNEWVQSRGSEDVDYVFLSHCDDLR